MHSPNVQPAGLKYGRILRAVGSTLWAIVPERLADIVDVLAFQAGGGKLTAAEIREYVSATRADDGGMRVQDGDEQDAGAVAVIAVRGIIAPRIEMVDDISGPGGTSVERTMSRFRAALEDPRVGDILLDIDSPGGAVDLVPELAAEIRAARGRKRIVAVANTFAASAAYWIASAADEISISPSGEVGSIGVFAAHKDISAKLEKAGEKVTLISAGEFKVEGNAFEPLSDEARATIQARVDEVFADFVSAVAAGRGVSTQTVENDFGRGRTVSAQQAVAVGMADRIETRDEAIARLRADRNRATSGRRAAVAIALA